MFTLLEFSNQGRIEVLDVRLVRVWVLGLGSGLGLQFFFLCLGFSGFRVSRDIRFRGLWFRVSRVDKFKFDIVCIGLSHRYSRVLMGWMFVEFRVFSLDSRMTTFH